MLSMATPRMLRRLYISPPRLSHHPRQAGRVQRQARGNSSLPISQLVFPEDDGAEPGALRHIHLTTCSLPSPYPSYTSASDLQTLLRQAFLDWKSSPTSRAPSPLVVSFTPTPTYTLGRRQKTLTPGQLAQLQQPLSVGADKVAGNDGHPSSPAQNYTPEVIETDRGGLTTYHGPGQVVLWPILDLHSEYYEHLTVRSYARLLEETTQALLASGPSVQTYLSEEDPGVWAEAAKQRTGGQERKIAAMGVHLRRHISGLGVALNVDVVVDGDETTNPWARFVPCGLEGKTATSVRAEVGEETWARWTSAGNVMATREWYARQWAEELARRLGVRAAPATVHHRLG
ncbi:putative octanoyltransferase [Colletotrichum chlorophyti]|uniref:lipoyl(octanoyl) transferase n=1 Tax=Colletotrichum chlorophyti TaxID=708187 RepID=A0A1Q8S5C1_9PEZI|nr:putative octanoyltransferase [Colletotrichum chlorophyti]